MKDVFAAGAGIKKRPPGRLVRVACAPLHPPVDRWQKAARSTFAPRASTASVPPRPRSIPDIRWGRRRQVGAAPPREPFGPSEAKAGRGYGLRRGPAGYMLILFPVVFPIEA